MRRLLPFIALYALLFLAAPGPIPRAVAGASLALAALLLWITLADLRRWRIPNRANALLALGGALATAGFAGANLPAHVLTALAIGAFFWGLSEAMFRLRGRDALGLGDAKLAAAAALWVGPWGMPSLILIAALSGLATAAVKRSRAIPFGPHLALALWVVWLYGPVI